MPTIKIGFRRLYNVDNCTVVGGPYFSLIVRTVGASVHTSISNKTITPVWQMTMKSMEEEGAGKSAKLVRKIPTFPSDTDFPADMYLDLTAQEEVDIEEELFERLKLADRDATREVLNLAHASKHLVPAVDFVAGVLALRLHPTIVGRPITENVFAVAVPGTVIGQGTMPINVLPTWECHVATPDNLGWFPSRGSLQLSQEKAAEILGWLIRASAAHDKILRFVSTFIPLERVIPSAPQLSTNPKERLRQELLEIVKGMSVRPEISKFLADLNFPPPLAKRFALWAREVQLPGYEEDVRNFHQLNIKRNQLVHRGKIEGAPRLSIEEEDVSRLATLAAKYVDCALFGKRAV